MKYAREVIDCMSAHPGREFRMGDLIRYCCGNIKGKPRHAAHKAVQRVVGALVETGTVQKICVGKTSCVYFMS